MGAPRLRRILFATSNARKVEEVNVVLRRCGFEAVAHPGAPKVELQSESLEAVAAAAAAAAYAFLRRPVIVEDAGLFVDALNGFPGPYSSYVYRTIGVRGLLKLLEGVEDRGATFVSVIALAYRGGVVLFRGEVRGAIAREPRGSGGFGFDPIFVPEGSTRTCAEMSAEEKTELSHRGAAARRLCEWLREHPEALE